MLPGWISGNIFMPPIVAFHEIPLVLRLQVLSVSVTSCGALEGLGRGSASLVVSLCRYLIIILPAAFILSHFFGAVGVWNAFWIAESLTAVVSFMISRKVIGIGA